jgi:hypothetical protein
MSNGAYNDINRGVSVDVQISFVSDEIVQLATAGGRNFLVVNLPPKIGPVALDFNNLLSGELSNLR